MNRQEIFNKVAKHLLTQNAKAKIKSEDTFGTVCAYRAEDGKKCAIGCLIPDDLYVSQMESIGNISPLMMDRFPKLKKLLEVEDYSDIMFLRGLQQIHDWHNEPEWASLLQRFAREHGLDKSVLSQNEGVSNE